MVTGLLGFTLLASKPPPSIETIVPEKKTSAESLRYVGHIEAVEAVSQIAPFFGRTIRQLVAPGTSVRKGQAILTIARIAAGEVFANYLVKANRSGLLNEYHVAPGQEFATNSPLFTVLDTSQLRIRLAISDKDHRRIKRGCRALIDHEGSDQPVEGEVYRKSLIPLEHSGLFRIEVRFGASPKLPIGSFASVDLMTDQVDEYWVPKSALLHLNDKTHVLVIDREQNISRRTVEVKPVDAKTVAITSGLAEGERVAKNAMSVKDHMPSMPRAAERGNE